MTTPDTAAIRGQTESLTGFIPGPWGLEDELRVTAPNGDDDPWYVAEVTDACGHPKDCAAENARLIAAAPDMHATILALCDALDELRADNERLQTIIGNLHTVEEELSETAKAQFHRANRLRAENQRLQEALTQARAALAQKGGK